MIVYHCAPKTARESILKHGIDTSRCSFNRWCEEEKGFYAFENLEEAKWYANYFAHIDPQEDFDIWKVNLPKNTKIYADLGLYLSSTSMNEENSSVHIKQNIKPSKIKLLMTV